MNYARVTLPDGREDQRYLNVDQEWPTLHTRLGQPRILHHYYLADVLESAKEGNSDAFSFLDAGCGHGNDLRAMAALLEGRGNFLGVDISRAEIMRGLDFYQDRDSENSETAIKMFGLGNLQDLSQISVWNAEDQSFSLVRELHDEELNLVHTEAVLHSFGYGHQDYVEKKASAQKALNEFFRVCKSGGIYFGRATVFKPSLSKEDQFRCLINEKDWRFIPGSSELLAMFKQAGFRGVKNMLKIHEKAATKTSRKDMLTISFLARK